ncbi:glutaredoxin 3 [Desulfosediminicola flagellatus]|uniref:glutaredoxin 3 n=1 Tax=Desulfosediminicola flagellatus TaxID=2569541 RepID=UPI0010AB619C|nr:glutaredoxin 3 [Desulfosediminicola flagellatus]
MKNITIYSTTRCPYCIKAKALFDRKNLSYEEIDVTGDDEARSELIKKANGLRTVPQIFIGDKHVGGCDDIYLLDSKGELDKLIEE